MIPVTPKPEPCDFNTEVRQKGLGWLKINNINLDMPLSKGVKLPRYWSNSNRQLWKSYNGICAYLAIYFDWPIGAASTDHFVAKSKLPRLAYEWSNYRLSALGPNRNKNKFDDVLDPFDISEDTFRINFANGEVYPNPSLSEQDLAKAIQTIKRLKLDNEDCRQMRIRHFMKYQRKEVTLKHLETDSPFVYLEVIRQGLQL